VQWPVPVGDERRDRCLIDEVERCDQDLLVAHAGDDVFGGALAGLEIAHGQGHLGVRAGERAGGLDADAGCAAGDDHPPAAEIDARDDVGGGRLRAEGGGDAVVVHGAAPLSCWLVVDASAVDGRQGSEKLVDGDR